MKLLKRKEKILDDIPGLSLYINGSESQKDFKPEIIEGLRHLITRVQQKGGFPKRLSLVAALRKEGVSYTSQALAATMAHDLNHKICLVDLNFWWPDPFLQPKENQSSLVQILDGESQLEDLLLQTNYSNLHILPSGEIIRHKRPILAKSKELVDLVHHLSSQYDYVILDIPAILGTTESVSLAALGNAACLVIHQGVTQVGEVSQALDEIEHLEIIGSILNNVRISMPKFILKVLANW